MDLCWVINHPRKLPSMVLYEAALGPLTKSVNKWHYKCTKTCVAYSKSGRPDKDSILLVIHVTYHTWRPKVPSRIVPSRKMKQIRTLVERCEQVLSAS